MANVRTPTHLARGGKALWSQVTAEYDLRVDELRLLEDACREIDLIERLETQLRDSDLIVSGSMGQKVSSPLVSELRQHRAVLKQLLAGLKLPDEKPQRNASEQGRSAARKRWDAA